VVEEGNSVPRDRGLCPCNTRPGRGNSELSEIHYQGPKHYLGPMQEVSHSQRDDPAHHIRVPDARQHGLPAPAQPDRWNHPPRLGKKLRSSGGLEDAALLRVQALLQ